MSTSSCDKERFVTIIVSAFLLIRLRKKSTSLKGTNRVLCSWLLIFQISAISETSNSFFWTDWKKTRFFFFLQFFLYNFGKKKPILIERSGGGMKNRKILVIEKKLNKIEVKKSNSFWFFKCLPFQRRQIHISTNLEKKTWFFFSQFFLSTLWRKKNFFNWK